MANGKKKTSQIISLVYGIKVLMVNISMSYFKINISSIFKKQIYLAKAVSCQETRACYSNTVEFIIVEVVEKVSFLT